MSEAPPLPFGVDEEMKRRHLYVLPVLFLEFLALALTRAVMPALLLETFADKTYLVMGFVECVRGLLAFVSCPLFGKLSDVVGRKVCLIVTVCGTCLPVCSLAVLTCFHHFHADNASGYFYNAGGGEQEWNAIDSSPARLFLNSTAAADTAEHQKSQQDVRIFIFVILLAFSGLFTSTFTLTFAYLSDTVTHRADRVTAYGLALATFGLSFTIGPMAGGYLSRSFHDNAIEGQVRVFAAAFLLTVVDLLYLCFFLPESNPPRRHNHDNPKFSKWTYIRKDLLSNVAWSPFDTLQIFSGDSLLYQVGCIAFFYYTALWAVVSTLFLYSAKRFHLTPDRMGELMSALGLCTMISEALLVRMIVPHLGEKRSMRLGLAAFSLQCLVLGVAYQEWQLFLCVVLSLAGNLVYPSLTSLVSGAVSEDRVGEALGAVNAVKALTEGLGPLIFGTLMTFSEHTRLPGWPYLLAAIFAWYAYRKSAQLPDDDDDDDDYSGHGHKNARFATRDGHPRGKGTVKVHDDHSNSLFYKLSRLAHQVDKTQVEEDEELEDLLSEVDEVDEDEVLDNYAHAAASIENGIQRHD